MRWSLPTATFFAFCCQMLLIGVCVADIDDDEHEDDLFSLLQAEVITKSATTRTVKKEGHTATGRLAEDLKAELSTDCVIESAQQGTWDATADVVVATKNEAPMAVAEESKADAEAQEMLQQVLSWGLRLSLQAAVLALLVDGIRRYQLHGIKDSNDSTQEISKEDELLRAAIAGDLECCKALLRTGAANVLAEDMWGCTALHAVAAQQGRDGALVACQLLQAGAKVHARDAINETPLHFAARAGNIEVCELLLAYGAQLDSQNDQELTPLLLAARAGSEDACKFLLGRGARAPTSERDLEMLPASLRELLEAQAEVDMAAANEEVEEEQL